MPTHETRSGLRPGPRPRTVRTKDREILEVPVGWELLAPGDAGLTRAVKAAGPTWAVAEKKGRRSYSKGVWAPAANIEAAEARLETKRADPAHQRKLDAARRRREAKHAIYVQEFRAAVLDFLGFHADHEAVARELARRVTALATPVGSGTVARTERIPLPRRAEAAVIAWMRHQTTAYDDTSVAREKGARRELRRKLAARSRAVLVGYRQGTPPPPGCPLAAALARPAPTDTPELVIASPRAPARAPERRAKPKPPPRRRTPTPPPAPPPRAPRTSARRTSPHAPAPAPPPASPPAQAPPRRFRPPVARDPRRTAPAAPEQAPTTPDDPPDLIAPRTPEEEAQRALYLKVLARRRRR